MFGNLQTAYTDLTQLNFALMRRVAELEAERERLRQAIASMSEAFFLMDRAGRVRQVNPAACRLLQCEAASLVEQPFGAVCGRSDIPATPWDLLQGAPSGRLGPMDLEIATRLGSRVPISLSLVVVRDQQGRITGMQAVARDISERKRAEEALARQARELARSNAELQQFAYVASHDLQEPLRMMASFARLLDKRYKGRLDADECIDYIVDGAKRMQRLIDDLLTYSRAGRQGRPFAPTAVAVVATACANLRAAIEESGARIVVEPLPVVMADEGQLVQLFQNLIGNAIKFRGDRPVEIHIGAAPQGDAWRFWLRHNGIGIEPRHAERIFLIFQRLHGRDRYPGTGIGLAIAKKIVERHGGRIWVESHPGAGSTFSFTLSAKEPPPESSEWSGQADRHPAGGG
jgi:PAS domain S-box-containing protein